MPRVCLAAKTYRGTACTAVIAVAALTAVSGVAQVAEPVPQIIEAAEPVADSAPRYGTPIATRYRVGAKVTAKGAAIENIRLMVAVPLECAEQEVRVVEEDFSPHVEGVEFRLLPPDNGARQMLITISSLPARQTAQALITYEVLTRPVIAPEETASLRVPVKLGRELKPFVSGSPYIDVNHRKIRAAVKEALAKLQSPDEKTDDDAQDKVDEKADSKDKIKTGTETKSATVEKSAAKPAAKVDAAVKSAGSDSLQGISYEEDAAETGPTAWERVEALYDFAIEKVKYEEGADKSSVQVLQDEKGDCQAIAALFVAMCRTEKIPARLVWVDGHQYAEFYLEDAAGAGHWYPVQSAGTRAFGEMPTPKVILQRGDNFRVPERRRERLRYASDYALLLADPAHQPKVAYIREQL